MKTTLRRKGFTLIELLVVVLILSILMAIALPLYLSAVADSENKTCRANMQTIANAVQAKRVSDRTSSYATIITAGVTVANLPDLGATIPKCPTTGCTYGLAAGTANPYMVTSTSHGNFEPGVNNF